MPEVARPTPQHLSRSNSESYAGGGGGKPAVQWRCWRSPWRGSWWRSRWRAPPPAAARSATRGAPASPHTAWGGTGRVNTPFWREMVFWSQAKGGQHNVDHRKMRRKQNTPKTKHWQNRQMRKNKTKKNAFAPPTPLWVPYSYFFIPFFHQSGTEICGANCRTTNNKTPDESFE